MAKYLEKGARFINIHSIKMKIISVSFVCILIVGLLSNFVVYNYLSRIILEKTTYSNTLTAQSVATQIEQRLQSAFNLLIYSASDQEIIKAAQNINVDTDEAKTNSVNAKKIMDTYLASNSAGSYINKYVMINTSGFFVQTTPEVVGAPSDADNILALPIMQQAMHKPDNDQFTTGISPSIAYPGQKSLVMIHPVIGEGSDSYEAFIYIELSLALLQDVITPFEEVQSVFVLDTNADVMLSSAEDQKVQQADLLGIQDQEVFTYHGTAYQMHRVSIDPFDLVVYTYTDLSTVTETNPAISIPIAITLITCFAISFGLAIILTTFMTRPLKRLMARIRRISDNDFSYDKSIETSKDEIGQIGIMINEMTLSIKHLLQNEQEMHEQQKNIEIELLQSQVTPHFLYNTLDSIYWMAVIQKCPGIANTVRSLVNLLKNIAKGTQSKISLAEEIALLQDYINIQSVRYLETFAFHCNVPEALQQYKIIKLTLQPIVENAIFHGIETSGRYGTITLDATEEEDAICITICDDGVGMSQAQCDALLVEKEKKQRSKSSMNGIGVSNVHNRLQLTYGSAYGLTVESEEGIGTCVSIRIPKETEPSFATVE